MKSPSGYQDRSSVVGLVFATPPRLLFLAFPLFLVNDPAFHRSPINTTLRKLVCSMQLAFGKPVAYAVGRSGARIVIEQNDIVSRIFFLKGKYEARVGGAISRLLGPGMTFVDAGANIGLFSLLASKIVGHQGQIHCFEPDPRNFRRLLTNIRLSKASNITANKIALTDQEGYVDLRMVEDDGWGRFSSLGQPAPGVLMPRRAAKFVTERVRCSTLSQYAAEKGIRRIHLVKLDVEGSELLALRGGQELLGRKDAPALICEFNAKTLPSLGYDVATLREYIESFGYRLYRIIDDYGGLAPVGKTMEIQSHTDLLALKSKRKLR
jgi:FkbM family methyltransferase